MKNKKIGVFLKESFEELPWFQKFIVLSMLLISPLWIISAIARISENPSDSLTFYIGVAAFIIGMIVLIKNSEKIFDFIGKLLPSKLIAYVIGGIFYGILFLLMMIPVLIFFYMLCRFCDLIGMAVVTAILKCFWIIK